MEVPMPTAYVAVTLVAVAANTFSGVAALVHFKPILPGMAKAGVPQSWLTFPIGTLKTAGAIGLLLGLIGVPLIGTAAAIGLVLFFVCAVYTHVRAGDYSVQFGLANGFLLLAVATLALNLAR
jgi:DoxX-like family